MGSQEALDPSLPSDLPCDLGQVYCLPFSSLRFLHLGGNVMKLHPMLQAGMGMCCGHVSIQPLAANGLQSRFWAVTQGPPPKRPAALAHQSGQHKKTSAFV